MNSKISQLNLKHSIEVVFPRLTSERLDEFIRIHASKGEHFITKPLSAKKQRGKEKVQAPDETFKLSPPALFDIPVPLKEISAQNFKVKIKKTELLNLSEKLSVSIMKFRISVKLRTALCSHHAPYVAVRF